MPHGHSLSRDKSYCPAETDSCPIGTPWRLSTLPWSRENVCSFLPIDRFREWLSFFYVVQAQDGSVYSLWGSRGMSLRLGLSTSWLGQLSPCVFVCGLSGRALIIVPPQPFLLLKFHTRLLSHRDCRFHHIHGLLMKKMSWQCQLEVFCLLWHFWDRFPYETQLISNVRSSCLSLLGVGVPGIYQCIWFRAFFFILTITLDNILALKKMTFYS